MSKLYSVALLICIASVCHVATQTTEVNRAEFDTFDDEYYYEYVTGDDFIEVEEFIYPPKESETKELCGENTLPKNPQEPFEIMPREETRPTTEEYVEDTTFTSEDFSEYTTPATEEFAEETAPNTVFLDVFTTPIPEDDEEDEVYTTEEYVDDVTTDITGETTTPTTAEYGEDFSSTTEDYGEYPSPTTEVSEGEITATEPTPTYAYYFF